MGRAPCCDKAKVKRGPWCPEEDAKLRAYIEEHGTGGNWIALPHKIGLKRCGKSCRLRWLNYLRPNIKHGDFSQDEDFIICSLYISIGSRWSIIAAQLPGRTDNDVKNYWNTKLKKKFLGKNKQHHTVSQGQSQRASRIMSDHSINSEGVTISAIERMQLQMKLQNLYDPFSFCNQPELFPGWKDASVTETNHQTECSQINLHRVQDLNSTNIHSPSYMNRSSSSSISNGISEDKNGFIGQDEYGTNGLFDCGAKINWEKESVDSWATSISDFQEVLSAWDLSALFQTDIVLHSGNKDLQCTNQFK